MNISKTTVNFARARNLDITVWADNKGEPSEYAIWFADDENVPAFIISTGDSGFYLMTNHQINASVWEDLMYWMRSEKQLRKVLDYIHNNQYNVVTV